MLISILLLIFSIYYLYKNKKENFPSDNKSNDKNKFYINLVIGIFLFTVSFIHLISGLIRIF